VSESAEMLAETVRTGVSSMGNLTDEAQVALDILLVRYGAERAGRKAVEARLAEAEKVCDAKIREWQDFYWPLIEACKVERDRYRAVLGQIAKKRPNKTFDPWAVEVARAALDPEQP
jgi:hypothetical protein